MLFLQQNWESIIAILNMVGLLVVGKKQSNNNRS